MPLPRMVYHGSFESLTTSPSTFVAPLAVVLLLLPFACFPPSGTLLPICVGVGAGQ